ncbi:reverse transcriptase-like protein [Oceanobacillus polygoni]|uniref:Ribonuclease HI n=1 Tax=Oceanobacillus polygoni TaxID=1235259 RepID=A0A9X0YR36_9BACI|nr:reverse transcriptase-like protein [Oceanobacillus polygoni]MBP2077252.1 ribonuclease HI [Oceanobacillus polygoni]
MQVRMELTYRTKKGLETIFSSDMMQAGQAIVIAEDMEKTGRIKQLTFIDSNEGSWTYKQLKKYMEEIKTEPHDIIVYFDGGFDLKTNKAGLGCVIYYEQNEKAYRIRKNALVEGLVSNNEAEYAALHLGLTELELLGAHHLPVTLVGDSKVVIHQLDGEWPCYEKELAAWIDRIERKLEQLGITPTYKNVSRKMNREADQLATQALQEIEITSHRER